MANFVNLLDIIYPVGSVYISTNTASPSNSIGGTWTAINNAILAASGSDYTTQSGFGGDKAMTVKQMPSHSHIRDHDGSISGAEIWEYMFHVMQFSSTGTYENGGRYGCVAPKGSFVDIVRFCSVEDATIGGAELRSIPLFNVCMEKNCLNFLKELVCNG